MGLLNISANNGVTSAQAASSAPTPAQQQAFGGKANTLTNEQRAAGGRKAAENRRKKAEEAERLKAELAALRAGQAAPAAAPTVAIVPPPAAPAPAPVAKTATKADEPAMGKPKSAVSELHGAFNFKLSIPTDKKFTVTDTVACDATKLLGQLCLSMPSFGLSSRGQNGYDWTVTLVHRGTGSYLLVCAKGNMVSLASEFGSEAQVPADLRNELVLIAGLIAKAA